MCRCEYRSSQSEAISTKWFKSNSSHHNHGPDKVNPSANTATVPIPRSDLFSESANVDRWKCFSCWCITLRNMNIYTEVHMGALHHAAESQKSSQRILLPSSVSPNSPSVNSLLKTQTHQIFPLRSEDVVHPAHAKEVKNPPFALPWKHPLKRQKKKKPNPSPSLCEKQKAHVIQGNSQLAVYPQTKALGRMKGKLGCLLELLSGPLAEPQIASLLFTMQP